MRILILGGTSFIGPHVVRELAAAGHELILFHRGKSNAPLPTSVQHVFGDFSDFSSHVGRLKAMRPEIVLDMVPFREEDGRRTIEFSGVARRSVILSSCDVYRAFGRVVRTEPGEPDPVPLTETSPLREKLTIGGENYNKTAVERVAASDPNLPCTILRLPATHGPGDRQHRLYEYAKRMTDRRPAILIDEMYTDWHWVRGYVENVAHAVALATMDMRATGHIYNVADEPAYTEMQWVQRIARAIGYTGRICPVRHDLLPEALRCKEDTRQQIIVDSTRIRRELGFNEIIPEEVGLRRTIEWELANPPENSRFDYAAEDKVLSRLA